ncbi:hypothetical protein ABZ678_37210 [Streptomyces hirsutus]
MADVLVGRATRSPSEPYQACRHVEPRSSHGAVGVKTPSGVRTPTVVPSA